MNKIREQEIDIGTQRREKKTAREREREFVPCAVPAASVCNTTNKGNPGCPITIGGILAPVTVVCVYVCMYDVCMY